MALAAAGSGRAIPGRGYSTIESLGLEKSSESIECNRGTGAKRRCFGRAHVFLTSAGSANEKSFNKAKLSRAWEFLTRVMVTGLVLQRGQRRRG